MTWLTELECMDLDAHYGRAWVQREGTRWAWRVSVHGEATMEASGYASSQEDARATALRVADGLKRLAG